MKRKSAARKKPSLRNLNLKCPGDPRRIQSPVRERYHGSKGPPEDGIMSKQKLETSAGQFSRRSFLSSLGAAGVVISTGPLAAAAPSAPAIEAPADTIEGAVPVSLRVNGKELDLHIDPRTSLLDCLRETISLTGTKKVCDPGQCGACTVHVNGRRINSCLT